MIITVWYRQSWYDVFLFCMRNYWNVKKIAWKKQNMVDNLDINQSIIKACIDKNVMIALI